MPVEGFDPRHFKQICKEFHIVIGRKVSQLTADLGAVACGLRAVILWIYRHYVTRLLA